MVSRRYYHFLILRILLIALSCLLLFFCVFTLPNISLIIIVFLAFLGQVMALIRYLNKINRKLEDFFISHISGEVTTSFIRNKKKDEFSEMYDYFKKLNLNLESSRVRYEIQNNYFKTLVDHAAVGLISFTSDGKIEFYNDATRRIFQMHVMKNVDKLDCYKEGLSNHLIHQATNQTDVIPVIIKGELIQMAIRKVIFKTDEKTIHLVSIQNIKPELEQKEIESWQQLIRVLTHEITNSITPIISNVSSIISLYKDKKTGMMKSPEYLSPGIIKKTLKGLELIENRSDGLVQFIANYREVTRLPKPNFSLINARELLDMVLMLFEGKRREKNIRMVVDCHPNLLFHADKVLLEQVLINLVKNAAEACSEIASPRIILRARSQQERVIIEVEDNGNGIPSEVVDDIFVPFFTTKAEGSGIGLSLSRQIIRLHGGSLDLQISREGKTVFVIKI